jgi:hypothetical protein
MTARRLLTLIAATMLAAMANGANAGGKLPPPRPEDLEALQACLGSRVAFEAASCIGAAANACLKTADSQQRMTQCMVRERAVWDTFLANDMEVVMVHLSPAARSELLEIDRHFRADTDRRCTFIRKAAGYSSYIQVVEIEECAMHATAVQWLWLRDFLPVQEKGPKPNRN